MNNQIYLILLLRDWLQWLGKSAVFWEKVNQKWCHPEPQSSPSLPHWYVKSSGKGLKMHRLVCSAGPNQSKEDATECRYGMWHPTYRVFSVYDPKLLGKTFGGKKKPSWNVLCIFLMQLVSPPHALLTSECFFRREMLFSLKVLLRTGSDRQSLANSEPTSAACALTPFLIWATHPGFVLKAPSPQWGKEQQHKTELCLQDTSISPLPLFWSMDFLLMETIFNY